MAAKKTPPVTEEKSVVKWDEELAKFAESTRKEVQDLLISSNFIGTKAGQLTIKGNKVKDNKLTVICANFVYENSFYDTPYDPDNPTSPVCFAISTKKDGMVPHANSLKKQSEDCASCPQNAFGSADKGKGKACQNRVRVALLSYDEVKANGAVKAESMVLRIPPTSGGLFGAYCERVANDVNRPYWAVATEISTKPDDKTQFKFTFELKAKIEDKYIQDLMTRRNTEEAVLLTPYQRATEEPAKTAKPAAKKPVNKFAKR